MKIQKQKGLLPCPHCGKYPDTMSIIGITTTCCLSCTSKIGAHGIPARNVSTSKKLWNLYVEKINSENIATPKEEGK